MKLKELLEVVPKDYEIGLVDFDKEISIVTYDSKENAIMSFVQKATSTKEQVENMDVVAIHPNARTYCPDESMFGYDMPSLHIHTRLLIEIK